MTQWMRETLAIIRKLVRDNDKKAEQIRILRKGLEFYAEERHFKFLDGVISNEIYPFNKNIVELLDSGGKAIECLEKSNFPIISI